MDTWLRRRSGPPEKFGRVLTDAVIVGGTPDIRSCVGVGGVGCRTWATARGFQRLWEERVVDDALRRIAKFEVAVAGVSPEPKEGLFHVNAKGLGHDPFGLFDDDATVESLLQLFVEALCLGGRPLGDDADGGYVGQRLGDNNVGVAHLSFVGAEQV